MESGAERLDYLKSAVLARAPEYEALWQRVVCLMEEAHAGQFRNDDRAYLGHVLDVAEILASWEVEPLIVLGGLLHDAVRYGHFESFDDLRPRLQHDELAALLDVVTRLGHRDTLAHYARDNNLLQQFFDLMVEDVRAVLIRCANRLANLRDLNAFKGEHRRALLLNSEEVYLPLLERLGIWRVRVEMEDILFELRSPDRYLAIRRWSEKQQEARADEIAAWVRHVEKALRRHGLGPRRAEVEIIYRHPTSIFRQHLSGHAQDMDDLSQLDARHLFITNVLTRKTDDAYLALAAAHECGVPSMAAFRDYLAQPKANGYGGLHTTVIVNSEPRRVHVTTHNLRALASNGILLPEAYRCWCEECLPESWQPAELRALTHFTKSLRHRPKDGLAIFTPRGDVIEMCEGATVLDFAYEIHTNVGRQAAAGFVNGVQVALNTKLHSGDVVEIRKNLSREWPDPQWLDWARTGKAREAIQMQLKQRPEAKGLKLVDKELRQRGRKFEEYKTRLATLASEMGSSLDEVYVSVARGNLAAREIVDRLLFPDAPQRTTFHHIEPTPETAARFPLWHQELILSAECCAPAPGDPIVGYHTERGIELHRPDCPNLLDRSRVVGLQWRVQQVEARHVAFTLRAVNRKGLINDLTQAIRRANVDILYLEGKRQGEMDEVLFKLEITNELELGYLLSTIQRIPNVIRILVDGQEAEAAMTTLDRYLAPPQPIISPFSPGKPVFGDGRFWGRTQEMLAIETHLASDSSASLLLRGPRRIGKTSLLKQMQESKAIRERYRYVFLDLQSVARTDAPGILRQLARQLSRALDGEQRVAVPTTAEFVAEPLDTFLNYLNALTDAHRHAQKKILLALDEFATLVDAVQAGALDSRIFHMLRSIMQHNNLLTVLLCTSDDVAEMLEQQGVLELLNVAQEVRLGHLDNEASQQLIQEPLRGQVYFEPDAIAALLRVTDQHPYYLHILGANLVSMLNKERRRMVFADDIDTLVSRHQLMNGSEFMHLWERDEMDQRMALAALCTMPPASAAMPITPEMVQRRLREAGVSLPFERVAHALDCLTRMETLSRAVQPDGTAQYYIRVELFRHWFGANHPLHRGVS
ncbi:MAG TPA: HD domain-containing protein [Ardenticatenaceae bacterium]